MEIQKSLKAVRLHGVKGDYVGKYKKHVKIMDRRIHAENQNNKEKRKEVFSSVLFNFQLETQGFAEIHP